MPIRPLTEPAHEPLSLADAKAHLRLEADDTSLDDWLGDAIASARAQAEARMGRTIVQRLWQLTLDRFPRGRDGIRLPKGRALRVVSLTYTDTAGATQTLTAGTDFMLANAGDSDSRIVLPYGVSWPTDALSQAEAIRIRYEAGMLAAVMADAGADTVAIPAQPDLAVGDPVTFCALGAGALPGGIDAGATLYVRSVEAAGVYTLAATAGGALLDITTAGSAVYLGVVPADIVTWLKMAVAARDAQRSGIGAAGAADDGARAYWHGLLDDHTDWMA